MAQQTDKVTRLIQQIRRRWKQRALIQGGSITLILLLVLAALLLLTYLWFEIPPLYQVLGLSGAALIVLGAVFQWVVRPLFRPITDQQVALYIEEQLPELHDRLNSAVEIEDLAQLRQQHGPLLDRLIEDASRKAQEVPITTVVDRRKEQLLIFGAAGVLSLFLLLGLFSFDELRSRFSAGPTLLPIAAQQPYLQVNPGSIELEQGNSQEVIATLREETNEQITIHYRQGNGLWQQAVMQKGLTGPEYLHEFENVQQPIEYIVQVNDKRAGPYTLSLYKFPEVTQIDLTYTYPAYTGEPVQTEKNAGDIRGLKGSTVDLTVTTNGSAAKAQMVRENGSTLALEPVGEGRFQARFTLTQDDFYQINLTDKQDKQNKFPQQYRITVLEDQPPSISITDPGRDLQANAIQEVLVTADIQDDFGLQTARLWYSVNGNKEQSVALLETPGPRETSPEHLFFLEEFSLTPGDVISYYIEAKDRQPDASPEATDMYFIEVMPFDQRFSQAQNASAMGGAQPSGTVVSQQQIITATWKLYRQRSDLPSKEFEESLQALIQAQSNLQDNIQQRISSTAFSTELQSSNNGRQIVEALRKAVDQMDEAVKELQAKELKKALTPERKALNQLLTADAFNKERRIALSRNASGSGNTSATEERMSELMDLELDITKDKYEMQPRQSSQRSEQQLNETLDKVRELARKQERLLQQKQQENLTGEDRKRFVDHLQREQQKLQRQAENFARQMRQQSSSRSSSTQQMKQQLQRITKQMKNAERALREQDTQQARAQQQQASNELERLQRDLELQNKDNARALLDQFAKRFQELKKQQKQIGQDMEDAAQQLQRSGGAPTQEQMKPLQEKQKQVAEKLQQLQQDGQTIRSLTKSENPELARNMEALLRRMQQDNLSEKLENSQQALERGWLDYAQRLQQEMDASMKDLSQQLEEMDQQMPVTDEEQLARSLQQVQNLKQQMKKMQQQAKALQQSQEQQERSAKSARLQQQLKQAQQSAEQLQKSMKGSQQAQQQLSQTLDFIKKARADHTGVLLDEDSADSFFRENAHDPLSQVELDLAQQLDALQLKDKLFGTRSEEVPREYQLLVEKYYEQLSKSSQNR